MKKYTFLFFCFLPLLVQAQNIKGPYIGVTTQFQNTWIINDEQYEDISYKHTFTTNWAPFGVAAGYKFNENHNVQLEVIRSRQGETWDFLDMNGNKAGEKHVELVYWNIPLLFKYTTTGTLRFNFQIGPQVSVLQKGREENIFTRDATYRRGNTETFIPKGNYLLGSTEATDRQNDMAVGAFNKYDLGLLVGAGVEYSLTPSTYLSANLRSHYNFVNVRKEEYLQSPVDPDYYVLRQNLVVGLQIGIHYLFNTGDGMTPADHQ